MNNIFSSTKVKLVMVLVGVLAVVKIFAPQIFLGESPRINPSFVARLKNAPNYVASIPSAIAEMFRSKTPSAPTTIDQIAVKTPPTGLIFNNISKGVEAAEDSANKKVYLKIQPGTSYKIEEIEVNGVKKKVVRIYKE